MTTKAQLASEEEKKEKRGIGRRKEGKISEVGEHDSLLTAKPVASNGNGTAG